MSRHRQLETLQAAIRDELPGAAVQWLAALRGPLETLTMAAVSGEVSDEEFLALLEQFRETLPERMDAMDHGAMAGLMERGMGAAMANGITQRATP